MNLSFFGKSTVGNALAIENKTLQREGKKISNFDLDCF